MFLKIYLTALVSFLAVDGLWLGLVAKNFYQKQIGFLMKSNPNWLAAIIFYLIFIVGLVFFVISPGIESKSIIKTVLMAALFGLITYATYDLTNLATIKNWPLLVTIVDLLWGMTVSIVVSVITYFILKK